MRIIAEEQNLNTEKKKKQKFGNEVSSETDPSSAIEMEMADIEEAVPRKPPRNGSRIKQDVLTVDLKINKTSPKDSGVQETPEEKKKHKKKDKVTSMESKNGLSSENTEKAIRSKKRRKSSNNVSSTNRPDLISDDQPKDEVDIWIPNKKYKGQLSGFDPTLQLGKSGSLKQHRETKVKAAPASFAQFEEGLRTPPAFVRKAFTKLRPPQTEPVRKGKKMVGNGAR